MAIDRDELRRVMGHFAAGVTVITTHDGRGRGYGLTATAVASLSLSPPLLLICVDKKADSYPAFGSSGVFVVNFLSDGQEELSRCFAVSGGDKFAGVPCRPGANGAAVLEGCLAYAECRIVAEHDGGDHTIYVGEIDATGTAVGDPLLYFRGGYRRLQAT